MSYNNEHREDEYQNIIDAQIEAEEEFDWNYDICEETMTEMKAVIEDSSNPFLLHFCHPTALMGLIDSGKYKLPKQFQNKKTCEELLVIPEPIDKNCIKKGGS